MNTITTPIIAAIVTLVASGSAYAHGDRVDIKNTAKVEFSEVIYDSQAYNRGIPSYPLLQPSVTVAEVDMIYVDRAHGQAIYSYPGHWIE